MIHIFVSDRNTPRREEGGGYGMCIGYSKNTFLNQKEQNCEIKRKIRSEGSNSKH